MTNLSFPQRAELLCDHGSSIMGMEVVMNQNSLSCKTMTNEAQEAHQLIVAKTLRFAECQQSSSKLHAPNVFAPKLEPLF